MQSDVAEGRRHTLWAAEQLRCNIGLRRVICRPTHAR